jgi:hypothetical protein
MLERELKQAIEFFICDDPLKLVDNLRLKLNIEKWDWMNFKHHSKQMEVNREFIITDQRDFNEKLL